MKERGPIIIYQEGVSGPSSPYTVSVDKRRIQEFLTEMNVPNTAIERLAVRVGRGRRGVRAQYSHTSQRDEIRLYVASAWRTYQQARTTAERIIDKEIKPKKNQFEGFLATKKLSSYLSVAPPERGIIFAEKLFRNALNREVTSDFFHEARHLADRWSGRYRLWFRFYYGGIGSLFTILIRKLNVNGERSAANFEKQMKNDPKWRNLVKLAPKLPLK